jgi:hypothetical protein
MKKKGEKRKEKIQRTKGRQYSVFSITRDIF